MDSVISSNIHRFKKALQLVIRIDFKILLFAFNILNGRAPSHLSELRHVHSTGKSEVEAVEVTERLQWLLLNDGMVCPLQIKTARTAKTFKLAFNSD